MRLSIGVVAVLAAIGPFQAAAQDDAQVAAALQAIETFVEAGDDPAVSLTNMAD